MYSVGTDSAIGENAILWISNLDGTSTKQIQLASGVINNPALARHVALSPTHIYSVGTSGAADGTAILWITNLEGSSINQIQLAPSGNSSAEAAGIALSPTHIYSVGYDKFNNATLWITNINGTSTKQIQLTQNGNSIAEARGVAVSSTHAYIVGNDEFINPTLWISNLDGTSISQIQLSSGGFQTAAYNVAFLILPNKLLLENLNRYSPFVPLKK